MSQPMLNLPLQLLKQLQALNHGPRIAFVGIGQELRGDDVAGTAVARQLRPFAGAYRRLLVIDAGPVPENFIGALRKFKPDLTILIDAAQLDLPAGSIRWVDEKAITGISAFAHTLPLSVFTDFLRVEVGGEILLLGIQPVSMNLGDPLTPAAASGVRQAVETCQKIVWDTNR